MPSASSLIILVNNSPDLLADSGVIFLSRGIFFCSSKLKPVNFSPEADNQTRLKSLSTIVTISVVFSASKR